MSIFGSLGVVIAGVSRHCFSFGDIEGVKYGIRAEMREPFVDYGWDWESWEREEHGAIHHRNSNGEIDQG